MNPPMTEITLKYGDVVKLGENIFMKVLHIQYGRSGGKVRLGFDAPREIPIKLGKTNVTTEHAGP